MSQNFPKNFLWGAATAAHQVEGGQKNDWSEWELENAERLAKEAESKYKAEVPRWSEIKAEAQDPENYISGKAVDHYHHFREDIAIMKKLGFNTYRFSIEWSRVEPEKGRWDHDEIGHYREVLTELEKNQIKPMITLWHRTNPLWIAKQGDWQNSKTVEDFKNFADKMANEFKEDIEYWITLNEPMMSVLGGYVGGIYPPQKKNLLTANRVFHNMMSGHIAAYKVIKKNIPNSKVSITHASIHVEPYKNRHLNRLVVNLIHYLTNWRELDAVKDHVDFLGIQYYTFEPVSFNLSRESKYGIAENVKTGVEESDMGWPIHPIGMYEFTKEIWRRYKKPIIVTENGIADRGDKFRADFIKEHLKYLQKAMHDGVDIRGYLHWSLLDNLEWDKGFWPRFGLVEVDRKTMKRTIRPSALEYAKIIKRESMVD